MAIPKILGAQRDFSAGELDVSMKRADESALMKAGARQLANFRILNSKAVQNRPGRTAQFFQSGRVEQVLMAPGQTFYLVFGPGYLNVQNAQGTAVFSSFVKADGITPIPWTFGGLGGITYAVVGLQIFIAYQNQPGNPLQVLTWDGVSQASTWAFTTFAEALGAAGNQKRTLFYRISPQNITLLPSATTGNINITFSAAVLKAGMVGTRLAYCGRQLTITGITDSTHGTALVNEALPPGETLPLSSDPSSSFSIGDVVIGSISGAKGIVTALAGTPTNTLSVQLIPPNTTFLSTDKVSGPAGSAAMSGGATVVSPFAVSFWTDEVMNSFRGFPSSVAYDQGRLVLSNFPAVPSGIAWAAIGVTTDFYVVPDVAVGSTSSAIFEIAPGKSQVLYVIPGMESSEFVFCDNAIYFIPITVQNPLVPGSVQFTELSASGVYPNVQPRRTEQTIVYMKAGGIQVAAVQVPGAYNRPYIVDNISDLHGHLFKGKTPLSIAIPSATLQFEETYIYVAFADGSMAVGKYAMRSGLIEPGSDGKPNVGWAPWSGGWRLLWLSALGAAVVFCSTYANTGAVPQSLVEVLDDSTYLDSSVFVNAPLPGFVPSGGKGPLFWLANGSVSLMDGTRMMGTYQVDANGFIVPQGNAGENLASLTLLAGQPWTATLEPFVPDAPAGGRSMSQRMFKRRVSRIAVYVSNSTGFLMARLFAGPITRTSPPLGTIMNTYRVTTWNQDDDPTQPPPLREEAQRWRPIGRAYDPRVAIIKDTPGPLLVHEIGIEVSI